MPKFRIGVALGLAAGYYFGAKAGRERYEQINRLVRRQELAGDSPSRHI